MQSHPNLLSNYRADVERFFDDRSPVIVSNKDRQHAAILISTLFKKAEKEVIVLCRNLDGNFYGQPQVMQEVIAAVDRGVVVRIVVQEKPEAEELLKELMHPGRANRVEVLQCVPGSDASQIKANFTVVDGRAYRLESNRDTCEAYACANGPDVAKAILTLYQALKNDRDSVLAFKALP